MSETTGFAAADYAVFISVLVITSLIGIYQGIKDRKVKNVDNYQFGNRKMSPIAVGASLAVSYISAITLIGFPADAYIFGTINMWHVPMGIIPSIIACLYYIPLMRRINLQTMNEILHMGIYLYLPPLAIAALTPLSFDASVLITSGIVTLYTTVGGFKAVIWTDTLQSVIMLVGSIATFIRALIVVGGFDEVWEAAERGGRINHWDFNLDPTIQRTFWTIFIGYSLSNCVTLCFNQASVQRYQSCRSLRDARIACTFVNIPFAIFFPVCILTGYVAYAYFESCDPYLNGEIQKYDQMIPLLVSQIFRDAPGMTGLFVAAIYSGTLSNLSSGINSIGTLLIQDMIVPFFPQLNQTKKLALSKIIAVCIGILAAGIALGFQFIQGNFLPLAVTISGCLNGPTLGIFTIALFIPWTNAKGVVIGTLISIAVSCWIAIGALLYGIPPEKVRALPGSTQNCSVYGDETTSPLFSSSVESITSVYMTSSGNVTRSTEEKPHLYYTLYALSYQYYILLGFIVCTVVGFLASLMTTPNSPSKMDPKLFVPFIDNKYLPDKVRKFFRFGVPEESSNEEFKENDEFASSDELQKVFHSSKSRRSFESDDTCKFTSTNI